MDHVVQLNIQPKSIRAHHRDFHITVTYDVATRQWTWRAEKEMKTTITFRGQLYKTSAQAMAQAKAKIDREAGVR